MRNGSDRKKHLRAAEILGTVDLIWAVCTVNPFLVIAAICSWIAESGEKKNFARWAEILYIVGGVTSSALMLVIAFLGNVVSLFSGLSAIAGGAAYLIGATVVADVITALAAVNSHKGCNDLDKAENKPVEVGLFGSSDIYINDKHDE